MILSKSFQAGALQSVRQKPKKTTDQSKISLQFSNLSQKSSTEVRYIYESSMNQPTCPLQKSCFLKGKRSELNSKRPIRSNNMTKSQNFSQIPKYRYKSNEKDRLIYGMGSRQTSLSKSTFLRCGRVKKDKIPVNIFAMESVITGDISSTVNKQSLEKI